MKRIGYLALLVITTFANLHAQTITIVDAIPKTLSNETDQNSEPSLAINPSNLNQIVISVFTPRWGVCDPDVAPLLGSQDGGATWSFYCVVPSSASTADISLKFGSQDKLYAAIIRRPDKAMTVLRWDQLFSDNMMTEVLRRAIPDPKHIIDQPYFHGSNGNEHEVVVGENDWRGYPTNKKTASLDPGDTTGTSPSFASAPIPLDSRVIEFDGASIRPVVASDGTAYAAFISVKKWDGILQTSDVIVSRRDVGSPNFTSLVDPTDNLPGRIVASHRTIPWGCCLGQQRYGSHLSIAVDPNDSRKLYLAWADGSSPNDYSLHVRSSQDAGLHWSPNDVWTVNTAINPALAIDTKGIVGFLYQRLDTSKPQQRWKTELMLDGTLPIVLADTPAETPKVSTWGQPYIGDYLSLLAIGTDFFGVFSANNTPDPDFFPAGLPRYNRNHRGKALIGNDGSSIVPPSIDPFFFHISDLP